MRLALSLLTVIAALPAPGHAAAPGPPRAGPVSAAAEEQSPPDGDLPVSLDRIRRGLARPDVLRTVVGDDGRLVFRVEVEGQLPVFSDFIGKDESLVGPTPWGAMTHADFLQAVTPPTMRSFGAFEGGDLLQVLATSFATGLAMNGGSKMVGAVRNWVSDRRHRAAVEEVRAVLDEIARRQREEAARSTAEDEAAARKKEGKGPGEEGPRP